MTLLLSAVVISSVLGSLHCVGMCGPFAILAAGPGGQQARTLNLAGYHLGRLVTYLLAGGVAGVAGHSLSAGGRLMGVTQLAAHVAGAMMVAVGISRLVAWRRLRTAPTAGPSWWVRQIGRLRARLAALPASLRSFAIGGLTATLPCGWLYVFILVAAATGNVIAALALMAAFWVGTLPALTALVVGISTAASRRFAPMLQPALAVALVAAGIFTATGRATADLGSLDRAARMVTESAVNVEATGPATSAVAGSDTAQAAGRLEQLSTEPLPCCRAATTP